MKGFISEEALAEYSRLAAEKLGVDFAEGEVYDFARCMRADGSFYGTSGKCRKGSEAGDAPVKEKSTKSGGGNIPLLTNEDIAKKSTKELIQIKKQMDERAFGKGSKPVSNEMLQGMSDQNKRINEELKKRVKGGGEAPAKTPTQLLEEGSRNNPAVKRAAADKARRDADTQRMYDRAAQRRKEDEASGGPDELDRRIAAKAREANKLAYEGMKDAERRKKETEERRAKRNEPEKSLLQKLKERIKSKSKEG